jgi:hypothetical protein
LTVSSRNIGFASAKTVLARRLNGEGSGQDPKVRQYGSTAKSNREDFHMMSPRLQRLSNTWFLPLTLLVMSPVIFYEKWAERREAAELEMANNG